MFALDFIDTGVEPFSFTFGWRWNDGCPVLVHGQ